MMMLNCNCILTPLLYPFNVGRRRIYSLSSAFFSAVIICTGNIVPYAQVANKCSFDENMLNAVQC